MGPYWAHPKGVIMEYPADFYDEEIPTAEECPLHPGVFFCFGEQCPFCADVDNIEVTTLSGTY
jgi:hypothetical protein